MAYWRYTTGWIRSQALRASNLLSCQWRIQGEVPGVRTPLSDLTLVWDWNSHIGRTVYHVLTGWIFLMKRALHFATKLNYSVERGSVGNIRLSPRAKMLFVPMIFFSLAGWLCSGGRSFDWANVIFAAYFVMRGRSTHIDFLLLLQVGMIWPLMQECFLCPHMKRKALHCG